MIIIPNGIDWQRFADFKNGTCYTNGHLAEMLHPELWQDCVGAWSHKLDQHPWDYSGNDNNGARVGGVADGDGWDFDGVDDHIRIDDQTFVGERTLSIWHQTSVGGPLVNFGNGYVSFSNTLVIVKDAGNNRFFFGSGFVDNTWHQYIFTFDNTDGLNFYIDGVYYDNKLWTGNGWGGLAYIGEIPGHSYFIGLLDDVRIYNRALPAPQIQTLAQSQNEAYKCKRYHKYFISYVPPDAPTNLNTAALSNSEIQITWQDNSTNETGFRVERSTSIGGPFTEIATTTETTYTDTNLSENTEYCYRVRAYNGFGNSNYSNVDCISTISSNPYPTITFEVNLLPFFNLLNNQQLPTTNSFAGGKTLKHGERFTVYGEEALRLKKSFSSGVANDPFSEPLKIIE